MTPQIVNTIRRNVKEKHPLIHCITNPISINQCANTILAVGCRPIMAEHPDEVCEITETAQALLLNIGNITDTRMTSILLSAETSAKNNIPFVLDVVGISCSELRKNFADKLIKKYRPAIIKGNYSEINTMYDPSYKSCGVDADKGLSVDSISFAATTMAKKLGCIIMASGKCDIVADGKNIIYIHNGCPQLSAVTGTGCMLGALAACFLASDNDISAAAAACTVLGICGELSETEKGNGTFMVNLIDNLSVLTDKDIEKHIKLEEIQIEQA